MAEQFARYSKLQREINKLTDQVTKDVETRRTQLTKISYTMKTVVYIVYVSIMAVLFYMRRSEPVVVLPSAWFPYVNQLLQFPTGVEGAVGLPVWVLVTRQFMRALLA